MRVGVGKLVLQIVAESLVEADLQGIVKGIDIILGVKQQKEVGIQASDNEKGQRPEATAVGLKDKFGWIPIVGAWQMHSTRPHIGNGEGSIRKNFVLDVQVVVNLHGHIRVRIQRQSKRYCTRSTQRLKGIRKRKGRRRGKISGGGKGQ